MYDFVDRPVGRLCGGSRFVLWAMRAWTDALEHESCPPGSLATPFLRNGAIDALPSFHRVMLAVNRGARDTVMLGPVGCARIGESEAILLAAWARVDSAPAQVRATLRMMLEDEAAEAMFEALVTARGRLADAGLSPRGLDAARAG